MRLLLSVVLVLASATPGFTQMTRSFIGTVPMSVRLADCRRYHMDAKANMVTLGRVMVAVEDFDAVRIDGKSEDKLLAIATLKRLDSDAMKYQSLLQGCIFNLGAEPGFVQMTIGRTSQLEWNDVQEEVLAMQETKEWQTRVPADKMRLALLLEKQLRPQKKR